MEVDALNINGPLAIEDENTIKTETKTINTEKEEVVHKLKEALKFLENVNVQKEESLQLANLHAPLDELLANIKYFPVEDGRCFNDLPRELKANILSKSYLCDTCAYIAASVCHEWKDNIQKRLMERGAICIGEEDGHYDNCHYTRTEDQSWIGENMLMAAIIHKIKIKLEVRHVSNVDSKLLAEALTTISDFRICNYTMCFGCENFIFPVELTKNQLEHLFNAMEEKTEIDRVCLGGLSTAHLDQGKVIDCLFKVKELFLAEARSDCDDRMHLKWRDQEPCPPGGPVVDIEQFVEKLLQASSRMKLIDLTLGYFEDMPQNLSVNLANALCKVKSVSLAEDFPLQDATREQLIKNVLGGGIVMNSLSIMKEISWISVISVKDLEMAMSNMKCLKLRGDFTVEQLNMARSLSSVEVIEEINKKVTIYKIIKD